MTGGGGKWGYAAYRAPPTSLGQPDTLLDNISACRPLGNPARPHTQHYRVATPFSAPQYCHLAPFVQPLKERASSLS